MSKDMFRKEIKINDNLSMVIFYTVNPSHDVICLDVSTTSTGDVGHQNHHVQLSRRAAWELKGVLTDLFNKFPTQPTKEEK